MAHCLLIIWSQIFNLLDSSTEPFVILNPHGYLVFADFILLKSILTLFPEFSIKIESAEYFEKTTHSLFKEYRVKQGREFFKMELKLIKTALKQIKTITNDGKIKFKTGELKKKIGL